MPAIAITQTVKDIMPNIGFADVAPSTTATPWRRLGVALTTATSPLTSTLTLPKPVQKGYIRIRTSNIGVIAGTFSFTVTGTDGTNSVDLANIPASSSLAFGGTGATECERVVPFMTELLLTSVSVIATQTGVGGTSTLDWEIFGSTGSGGLD
jgi:hypothetical protein